VAVGPAEVLRRLRSLVLLGLCVCTVLSAGPLVLAPGATAGLRPDPPKLPQRPPPPAQPPPAASTTPAPDPAPAPPPATPPPPAKVVPAAPKQAPAQPRASHQTRQARATSAVRAAAARARKRHVEMTQARSSRRAKAVRTVTTVRRLPAAAYAISSSTSRTGVFLSLALTLLAVGLLLLGAILVPADVLPLPERVRALVELRGEITFAGLGILAACAAVSLLVLFVS
jgi:hypothetical protein